MPLPTSRQPVLSAARLLILLVAASCTLASHAHHSPVAFDSDAIIRFDGTVTRFDWTNPHVYIYVQTVDQYGASVEWQIESDWTNDLIRAGWSADSLAPGDRVSIQAHPARNTRISYANLISLEKSDGTVLASWDLGEREEASDSARATEIAGRWLGVHGFPAFFAASSAQVNANGARAQQAYQETENPGLQCTPHPLPTRLGMPHVSDIAIYDTHVEIVSESDPEPRIIYTDGRDLPSSGESIQHGHSIGHWEEGALVVLTSMFSINRRGNGFTVPSSAQKRLQERYELSEDGTQLRVNYILSDPEYLAGDVQGSFDWTYAPDLDLIPFSCDLEVAGRYLENE